MRLSVVVPTYKRPDSLELCLNGLKAQTRPADEVLVITQQDDEISRQLLADWKDWPALRVLEECGGGAIAQYNRGMRDSIGEVVAITDDDSIPRPDWLLRIERWFAENEDLGGVGGRDIVHEDGTPILGTASMVGLVQWFGRIVHNHHVGTRINPNVDILKGVNMSFRAAALRNVCMDPDLRGKGAQVCLDMALSMAVQKQNWRLLFDPEVVVDHFPAKRFDADQRNAPSMGAVEDSSYNFYLTLRRHMRKGLRQRAALIWARWVGTSRSPGILRAVRAVILRDGTGLAMRAAAGRAWKAAKFDSARTSRNAAANEAGLSS